MRISDWSSDVCSSDLEARGRPGQHRSGARLHRRFRRFARRIVVQGRKSQRGLGLRLRVELLDLGSGPWTRLPFAVRPELVEGPFFTSWKKKDSASTSSARTD